MSFIQGMFIILYPVCTPTHVRQTTTRMLNIFSDVEECLQVIAYEDNSAELILSINLSLFRTSKSGVV